MPILYRLPPFLAHDIRGLSKQLSGLSILNFLWLFHGLRTPAIFRLNVPMRSRVYRVDCIGSLFILVVIFGPGENYRPYGRLLFSVTRRNTVLSGSTKLKPLH